jgi:hemolysin activation/secretion protein
LVVLFRLIQKSGLETYATKAFQPIEPFRQDPGRTPFIDAGSVWNSGSDRDRRIDGKTFLAGIGMGLIWEVIPDLNIRLDYGLPLVDLDDPGNKLPDDGLYFSVNYRPF